MLVRNHAARPAHEPAPPAAGKQHEDGGRDDQCVQLGTAHGVARCLRTSASPMAMRMNAGRALPPTMSSSRNAAPMPMRMSAPVGYRRRDDAAWSAAAGWATGGRTG